MLTTRCLLWAFVGLCFIAPLSHGQTFDISLSGSMPFDTDGVDFEQATVRATGSTTYSDIFFSLQVNFQGLGFTSSKFTVSGEVAGVSALSLTAFTGSGFDSQTFNLSGKYQEFGWSSSTVLNAGGFAGQTFKVNTKQDTLSLAGTSKFGPEGFTSATVDVGAVMGGVSINRSTTFDFSTILQERWQTALTVNGVSVSRVAVYDGAGQKSDTFSFNTQLGDVRVGKSLVYQRQDEGMSYQGMTLTFGSRMAEVDWNSTVQFGTEGFQEWVLTGTRAFSVFTPTLRVVIDQEGFNSGSLKAGADFTLGAQPPEESEEEQ